MASYNSSNDNKTKHDKANDSDAIIAHDPPHFHDAPKSRDMSKQRRMLLFCFLLVTVFMLVEAVGGVLTNSLALLSDAGHMLSDAAALGATLLAFKIGEKEANKEKTSVTNVLKFSSLGQMALLLLSSRL